MQEQDAYNLYLKFILNMKTACVIVAMCLGLASAGLVKRQDMNNTMTAAPAPADPATTTAAPAPTQPPKPTKLTELIEIMTDFDTLVNSDFYKRLSYEDQLIILEVLTGSEVGKMELILREIGFEDFIRFLFEMPLKYIDQLKDVLDRGYEKQLILANSQ